MNIYQSNKEQFSKDLLSINKKYTTISFLRLLSIVIFIGALYFHLQQTQTVYIALEILSFATFILLMRYHAKLSTKRKLTEALIEINENEDQYLEHGSLHFANGAVFNDFQHPYAYDLDIFGDHSLFQNINRTATYVGKKTLANQLLSVLPNDEILENQEAVAELGAKIGWRQEFLLTLK